MLLAPEEWNSLYSPCDPTLPAASLLQAQVISWHLRNAVAPLHYSDEVFCIFFFSQSTVSFSGNKSPGGSFLICHSETHISKYLYNRVCAIGEDWVLQSRLEGVTSWFRRQSATSGVYHFHHPPHLYLSSSRIVLPVEKAAVLNEIRSVGN